jgi:hypothetical protein
MVIAQIFPKYYNNKFMILASAANKTAHGPYYILNRKICIKRPAPDFPNFYDDKLKVCPIFSVWSKNSADRPQNGRPGHPFTAKGNPFRSKPPPPGAKGNPAASTGADRPIKIYL